MLKIRQCFLLLFSLIISIVYIYGQAYPQKNIHNTHYINDYSPINEDNTINAVVEIPAGTNEKWRVTKTDGRIELEHKNGKPIIINYLGYPGNYGMIPQTILPKETGGDGDPLDVLVIGASAPRGSVVKCKLIGVLKFLDRGEKDDKLLAVLPRTALYDINNISQLDETFPGITSIIKTWFLYYKGSGKMIFMGYGSAKEAKDILNEAIEEYQKKRNKN